ncbi:MAG TPA: hypothetical protein VF748_15050 [Candidatus Acidoferrum sp.]
MFKHLVLSAALLGLATPVSAADLPVRAAVKAPPPVVEQRNFYIGGQVGMGFTPEENIIAVPGAAFGVPKLYPTSPSVGLVIGYLNASGPIAWGAEAYGDFNFSAQPLNCSAGFCSGRMRNSLDAGGDALFGIGLGQLIGYNPASVQPQNWPVPINVPASIGNNLLLLGSVGAYGRSAGLCANTIDVTGATNEQCGSEWMGGLSAGAQLRFRPAAQWEVAIKYHHDFITHTFIAQDSISLFSNAIQVKGQDRIGGALNFYF